MWLSFCLWIIIAIHVADCSFQGDVENLPSTSCALIVLTLKVDPQIFYWTTFLNKKDFTIFFIEDAVNSEEIIPFESVYPTKRTESSPQRYIVHLDSHILKEKRYTGLNYLKGQVTAWEKAMYFLIELKPTYQYMWFMEDDVLLLIPEAFTNIHKQLVEKQIDLSGNPFAPGDPATSRDWAHWPFIKTLPKVYSPPFYRSMACSVGISQKMLQKIAWFRAQAGRFEFLEVMFYTIAKKENLNILTPVALREIEWSAKHTCSEINAFKKFWYHPVKHQGEFIRHCIESHAWKEDILQYQAPIKPRPPSTKTSSNSNNNHYHSEKKPKRDLTLLCLQTHHYPLAIYDWTNKLPISNFIILFIEYSKEPRAASTFSQLPSAEKSSSRPPRFQLTLASGHSHVTKLQENSSKSKHQLLSLLTLFLSKFLPTASPYFTWLFELPLLIPSSQSFLTMHAQVLQSENHYLTMSETFQYHNSHNSHHHHHHHNHSSEGSRAFNPVMGISRKWFEDLKHQGTVPAIASTASLLVFGNAANPDNSSRNSSSSSSIFELPPLIDGTNKTCEDIRKYRQQDDLWVALPTSPSKAMLSCLS